MLLFPIKQVVVGIIPASGTSVAVATLSSVALCCGVKKGDNSKTDRRMLPSVNDLKDWLNNDTGVTPKVLPDWVEHG